MNVHRRMNVEAFTLEVRSQLPAGLCDARGEGILAATHAFVKVLDCRLTLLRQAPELLRGSK